MEKFKKRRAVEHKISRYRRKFPFEYRLDWNYPGDARGFDKEYSVTLHSERHYWNFSVPEFLHMTPSMFEARLLKLYFSDEVALVQCKIDHSACFA
ncbi:MAG: hypothetical protein RR365_01115 [Bacteroides sp.]